LKNFKFEPLVMAESSDLSTRENNNLEEPDVAVELDFRDVIGAAIGDLLILA
jgi:hypothetical protein